MQISIKLKFLIEFIFPCFYLPTTLGLKMTISYSFFISNNWDSSSVHKRLYVIHCRTAVSMAWTNHELYFLQLVLCNFVEAWFLSLSTKRIMKGVNAPLPLKKKKKQQSVTTDMLKRGGLHDIWLEAVSIMNGQFTTNVQHLGAGEAATLLCPVASCAGGIICQANGCTAFQLWYLFRWGISSAFKGSD